MNAAYNPLLNGFEIPAAILQPPMFEADMDAPVYFCRIGAIIGHEMTHGFDSNGRQYDAEGDLRDWWTPADAAAFEAEAQKLIDQANAFEVLPGLTGNGPLEVTENMADVGGVTLASEALRRYLADHPDEDVAIDGLDADAALLPRLGADVDVQDHGRTPAHAGRNRSPSSGLLSRRGAAAASRRLLRRLRHRAGRRDVAAAREARRRVVGAAGSHFG